MAATLSVRPNRFAAGSPYPRPPPRLPVPSHTGRPAKNEPWRGVSTSTVIPSRRKLVQAGSRADDSAPSEKSVENALKLLGVSEGASFDEILRAKNSVLAACKDDQEAIAQVPSPSFALPRLLPFLFQLRKEGKKNKTKRHFQGFTFLIFDFLIEYLSSIDEGL